MKNIFKIGIIIIGCINSIRADGQNTEIHLWNKFMYESPKLTFMKKHRLTPNEVIHFHINAFIYAGDDETRHLQLPPLIALQMGGLRNEYFAALKNLPDSRSFGKSIRWDIEEDFRQSLKDLIGDEKFIEWFNYMADKVKRKFKKEYDFTDEHFQIYQNLENRQTIDIQKIQNSAMPKEIKAFKIKRIKDAKVECLRKALPHEQFTKWYDVNILNKR